MDSGAAGGFGATFLKSQTSGSATNLARGPGCPAVRTRTLVRWANYEIWN